LDEFSTARLPVLLLFLICSTFRKDSGTGGITLDTSDQVILLLYYLYDKAHDQFDKTTLMV
jgi:hypothetical protein